MHSPCCFFTLTIITTTKGHIIYVIATVSHSLRYGTMTLMPLRSSLDLHVTIDDVMELTSGDVLIFKCVMCVKV